MPLPGAADRSRPQWRKTRFRPRPSWRGTGGDDARRYGGTQASLAAAQATGAGLSEREASHLTFFALLLTGQSAAALDAARVHLDAWPRDAAVMNYYGSVVGLLGASGRPGNKRMQKR